MASEASLLEDLVMQVKLLPTQSALVSFLHNNKNQISSKANKEPRVVSMALRLPNFLLSFFLLIELPEVIFNREMEREHSSSRIAGISSSRIPMASELDNDPPLEREKNRKEGDMVFNFR